MEAKRFMELLDADFYAGVPDSQLKALCDCLIETYGTDPKRHIIAANEGNAVGLAAGYHLATGKTAVVYLQNSGEGNIINPVASLCSDKVYGIPVIFVIGWRGEPGIHDEPQHIYQGEVTCRLLEDMDIAYYVLSPETAENEVAAELTRFRALLTQGKQVAFVVLKGALTYHGRMTYANGYTMRREEIIRHVIAFSGDDSIVSTTGKASRELFELREAAGDGHERDFLTVGSMGHSSSIALGIALQKPEKKVWILDGDGAALMHMGAMAVLGTIAPKNVVHIIINNGAHESVGGQPTAARQINLAAIAHGCGYPNAVSVDSFDALDRALREAKKKEGLMLIEAKSAVGARANLGRPSLDAMENKRRFITYLQKLARFDDTSMC